jgi:adenylate cyclase
MPSENLKRKLTAILSADVAGYSRLMGEDEEATIRTLKIYREVIEDLVGRHRGRVVDSPGDNILAEFPSIIDAVRCAVEIQKDLKMRNSQLPQDRRMEFRIGVNLGDVIEDGGRIYGNGVNVTARIESLAESGGISISGSAYDQVEGKLPFVFQYQGERKVKNIRKALRVYRLVLDTETLPHGLETGQIPERPSIAVLPFVNISSDPEQEYFSDGITEDIITDLSKISDLLVISRNSSFTYKGKAVNAQQISSELGVRYILEGSVRKAGNRIRINTQLIDGLSGGHVWAERYDRELKDIFDLQDGVRKEIISALALKLSPKEEEILANRGTQNLKAYDYALRGQERYYRFTQEANIEAQEMFERSIQLDPDYAAAYSWLAMTILHSWTHGWIRSPDSLDRAFELAQRAIELDQSLPEAYRILGDVYLYRKQHDEAIDSLNKAIEINPNYADALAGLADVLNWAGRPHEAVPLTKKAIRLNPYHHAWYLYVLGLSYTLMGLQDNAIEVLKRAVIRNPEFLVSDMLLTFLYAEMGHMDQAKLKLKEILSVSPDLSLDILKTMLPSRDENLIHRIVEAFRRAGMK